MQTEMPIKMGLYNIAKILIQTETLPCGDLRELHRLALCLESRFGYTPCSIQRHLKGMFAVWVASSFPGMF